MNERTRQYYAEYRPSDYSEDELTDVLGRCGPPEAQLAVSPSGVAYIRTTAQKEVPGMPVSLKEAKRIL